MHFHHKHDIEGCCDDHADQPALNTLLATLDRMEILIMSANQDSIDALAARLDAAEARIAAKLNEPAPAPVEAPLDLTALTAAADKLDALAPADAPAAPVEAPADQSQSDPAPVDVPAPDQGIPSVPLA